MRLGVLVAAGFTLRLAVALTADHTYHPDELFQVLEQAHRAVYGWGLIPWEYRFGVRSWITPGAFALVLQVLKFLNVQQPAQYTLVVKALLCLLSSSLIVSGYVLARRLIGPRAGWCAAALLCGWYELVYFAHHPLNTWLATYFLLAAMALAVSPPTRSRGVALGLCAAIGLALRLQLLPLVALVASCAARRWSGRRMRPPVLAFVLAIAAVGLVDLWTWGAPFVSYTRNVTFNLHHQVATLFGTEAFGWYGRSLLIGSGGLALGAVAGAALAGRRGLELLAALIAVVGVHSLIAHKEYRFVATAIPLWVILLAAVDSAVVQRWSGARTQRWSAALTIVIPLAVSVAGLAYRLPAQERIYPHSPLARQDNLAAYRFVARLPDVGAVLDMTGHPYAAGGYYHLHQPVPLYFNHSTAHRLIRRSRIPGQYVTHILCRPGTPPHRGFDDRRTIGRVVVRQRRHPSGPVIRLRFWSPHVLFHPVDARLAAPAIPQRPFAQPNLPRR